MKSGTVQRHLAQEVHHRADVEELHAQRALPQVDDLEPHRLRRPAGARRAAALVDRLGPHQEVRQLAIGARADLLRQIRPARPQDPGDLPPETTTGWRLTTRSNEASREGQRGRVRRGDHVHARAAAGACRATSTLGHHPSVATRSAGGRATVASTSPAARLDVECGLGVGPCAPPSGARSPRAGAPRWRDPRTRRSPSPRQGHSRALGHELARRPLTGVSLPGGVAGSRRALGLSAIGGRVHDDVAQPGRVRRHRS